MYYITQLEVRTVLGTQHSKNRSSFGGAVGCAVTTITVILCAVREVSPGPWGTPGRGGT